RQRGIGKRYFAGTKKNPGRVCGRGGGGVTPHPWYALSAGAAQPHIVGAADRRAHAGRPAGPYCGVGRRAPRNLCTVFSVVLISLIQAAVSSSGRPSPSRPNQAGLGPCCGFGDRTERGSHGADWRFKPVAQPVPLRKPARTIV